MKISFLSPAYNSAKSIKIMLDSIPKEYVYEIIVCDDGSIDHTLEILEKYKKGCPQLKILRNEQNMGAGYSYNRCIAEAKGDYIAIIDTDDMYLPPIRDVLALVDGKYDIYYYNMLTKDGQALIKRETDGYLWPGGFKIIRRSFIDNAKFAIGRGLSPDGGFHKTLIDKNPKCKYTNIFAYWYNYPRKNSVSDLNHFIMWTEDSKRRVPPTQRQMNQRRLQLLRRQMNQRRLQLMQRQINQRRLQLMQRQINQRRLQLMQRKNNQSRLRRTQMKGIQRKIRGINL